jgi:hypothetical protein
MALLLRRRSGAATSSLHLPAPTGAFGERSAGSVECCHASPRFAGEVRQGGSPDRQSGVGNGQSTDGAGAGRGVEPMVAAVLRARRRKVHERMLVAATRYADRGWPVCAGAYPPDRQPQPGGSGRACSCDRIGCPAPGAHPISPAWQRQATADKAIIGRWWTALPEASIILVTGRSFDVLDVPVPAGRAALARMERSGVTPGPVAVSAQDRALFLVAPRAAFADED